MTKHVMAMFYKPKIEAVFTDKCHQTIRSKQKVKVGDEILFFAWSGVPYHSKWAGERLRVWVSEVYDIEVNHDLGIKKMLKWFEWDHPYVTNLAHRDYIQSPTGTELRNVLFSLNNSKKPFDAQIIRWD